MSVKNRNIPISFSYDTQEAEDSRFLKVSIDVLHTGENLNSSYFTKDVVEQSIDSIRNTPILGYIEASEGDFLGHEFKVVRDSDGYTSVYAGHAYGVIPETCNPRWTTKVSSDGTTRDYLQVDAYMWTKFSDALEIMERDVVKNQSMEIVDCEGYEDEEDGLFHFTSFKFDGCCLLSTTDPHIKPAMIDASITANFAESLKSEINEMMQEYSAHMFTTCEERKESAMENNVVVESQEVEITNPEEVVDSTVSANEEFEQTGEVIVESQVEETEEPAQEAEVEEAATETFNDEELSEEDNDSKEEASEEATEVTVDEEQFSAEYVHGLEAKVQELSDKYEALEQEMAAIKPKYDHYVELEAQATAEAERIEKTKVINAYESYLKDNETFQSIKAHLDDYSLEEITAKVGIEFINFKSVMTKNFSVQQNSLRVEEDNYVDDRTAAFVARYGKQPVKK